MKNIIIPLVVVLVIGCNQDTYKKDSDGNFELEVQVNDSIVKRKRLDSNRNLIHVEVEDVKNKRVTIFYFDESGTLDQSVSMSTDEKGLVRNDIFVDGKRLVERRYMNTEKELVSRFEFNMEGKLFAAEFYREGNSNINSFITYRENGNVDLTKGKSKFLKIWIIDSTLFIKPMGIKDVVIEEMELNFVNAFRNNGFLKDQPIKSFYCENESLMSIKLLELNLIHELKGVLRVKVGMHDDVPIYQTFEFCIDDIKSPPPNNLSPILKK